MISHLPKKTCLGFTLQNTNLSFVFQKSEKYSLYLRLLPTFTWEKIADLYITQNSTKNMGLYFFATFKLVTPFQVSDEQRIRYTKLLTKKKNFLKKAFI